MFVQWNQAKLRRLASQDSQLNQKRSVSVSWSNSFLCIYKSPALTSIWVVLCGMVPANFYLFLALFRFGAQKQCRNATEVCGGGRHSSSPEAHDGSPSKCTSKGENNRITLLGPFLCRASRAAMWSHVCIVSVFVMEEPPPLPSCSNSLLLKPLHHRSDALKNILDWHPLLHVDIAHLFIRFIFLLCSQVEVAYTLGCVVLNNRENQENVKEEKFSFRVLLELLYSSDKVLCPRCGQSALWIGRDCFVHQGKTWSQEEK